MNTKNQNRTLSLSFSVLEVMVIIGLVSVSLFHSNKFSDPLYYGMGTVFYLVIGNLVAIVFNLIKGLIFSGTQKWLFTCIGLMPLLLQGIYLTYTLAGSIRETNTFIGLNLISLLFSVVLLVYSQNTLKQ